MADWAARRFWKETTVVSEDGGGWGVRLDGRAVKTPLKTPVVVPTEALARAMAAEWEAQEEKVDPLTMPVTRACNAALDKVSTQHAEVAEMLAAYGGSDLLCYRAEAPVELVERQAANWDPLLDWAAETYDARLRVTAGILPVAQDPAALEAMAAQVRAATPFGMTALHDFVTLSGSLVIGLAAFARARPLDDLWALSRIDEDWQAEQWGADDEAVEAAETRKNAFLQAGRFHDMLSD